MRFTISREVLRDALAAVLPAVEVKSTLAVVTHCLVQTTENGVRLTGMNFDHHISVEVPADVQDAGAVTVPAQKLKEIIAKLPPAPIDFSEKTARITIKCADTRFSLLGFEAKEFPSAPKVDFTKPWRVRVADLNALTQHVSFATSNEPSRPILHGVYWELKPDTMRMVATNGHRLAILDRRVDGARDNANFIVPPWALEQASRLYVDDEEVDVAGNERNVAFRSPTKELCSRLIEGPYPNYDQVIPKDNDLVAVLDRVAFAAAVDRMNIVASGEYRRVELTFDKGSVALSSKTPDVGEASDRCAAQYTGKAITIILGASYLSEILRHVPGTDVKVTLKSPRRAVTIEPTQADEHGAYLCLLMPLSDPR